MIKGSIYQGDILISDIYASNIEALKYIKQIEQRIDVPDRKSIRQHWSRTIFQTNWTPATYTKHLIQQH